MNPRFKYIPLRGTRSDNSPLKYEDDADSHLLDEGRRKTAPPTNPWRILLPWIAHVALASLYLGVLTLLAPMAGKTGENCVEKLNYYSPILPAISEDYETVTYNGSLWYQGPYKGPPTPEVNRAWEELMQYGAISVTAEDILRIGHHLNAVQYPPAAGGGYVAVAASAHHIHCLHYIWQDHHIGHFPSMQADKAGTPEMYERHYEHCIDYLRQGIMCNYDPGIIPYYWVREHNQPTPDGTTRHKCVNWGHLQEWLKDRAVEIPEGFVWHQPPGALSLDQNP